jgi:anthranilate/para-aminobenzoate synthase component I
MIFQIDKTQIGCRLKPDELEIINSALEVLQEKTEEKPATIKDALLLLADNALNPTVINNDEEIESLRKQLETSENIQNDLLAERLRNDEQEKTPSPKETETEPYANVIQFELSDNEKEMAEKVRNNRAKELVKQGDEPETIEELFKNSFFDSGNLISFNGGWFTGIN